VPETPTVNFPWWFQDTFLAYLQTWSGLISLIVGVLTLIAAGLIAYRQFKIMDRQTKMMEEQGALAKRQTELAESQNTIIQEQLKRVARPELELYTGASEFEIFVCITNFGSKAARDVYWHLFVPVGLHKHITIEPLDVPLDTERVLAANNSYHVRIGGLFSRPVYAGKVAVCAKIVISQHVLNLRWDAVSGPTIGWVINSEDGRVPKKGYNWFEINGPTWPPGQLQWQDRQS
jgi:hypothetical protein